MTSRRPAGAQAAVADRRHDAMAADPTRRAAVALRVILGIAAIAALVVLARVVARRAGGPGGGEWAEVRRDDLVISVPVAGTLAAVDAARLGPPAVPGMFQFKITFIAPEGRFVRSGQPVLAFDGAELEKMLHGKEAERDAAQEKLEKRRSELEISRRDDQLQLAEATADHRKKALKAAVPPGLMKGNDLADARTDLDLAARQVAYYQERLRLTAASGAAELRALAEQHDRAAGRVAEVRAALARLRVSAPRAGTIIYVADRRGQKKKVGDSCWFLDRVIEIPDLRRLQAEGEIDESDAGRVAAGQRVALRLDAHPDVVFAGRVRTLHGAVQARSPSSPAKVVKLEFDLARTDPLRMRPGMRFVGTVEVARAPAVLVVPLDAVVSRGDGPLVYRRARFGVEAVRPRLGRHNDLWVEVLSGLRAGDLVRRAGEAPPETAAPAAPAVIGVSNAISSAFFFAAAAIIAVSPAYSISAASSMSPAGAARHRAPEGV